MKMREFNKLVSKEWKNMAVEEWNKWFEKYEESHIMAVTSCNWSLSVKDPSAISLMSAGNILDHGWIFFS